MRVRTRWLLGLALLVIPALLFAPGIGPFQSPGPGALARANGPNGTWYYRVRNGDVLSRIAERELGTHLRYQEILSLNPGVKPRHLLPGTVLRMPPRKTTGKSEGTVAEGPGSRDLLISCAALLALLLGVIFVAGRMER
jgi:hypothetical protein